MFNAEKFSVEPSPPVSRTIRMGSKKLTVYKTKMQGMVTLHLFYFLATFFLPATVLRFPLRVRLLVRVRWPRTGKPLRWRRPR